MVQAWRNAEEYGFKKALTENKQQSARCMTADVCVPATDAPPCTDLFKKGGVPKRVYYPMCRRLSKKS